jgi:hypothetical protein
MHFKVAIMCLKMQFAVLYKSYAEMGYKQLHGVTLRYMIIWHFAVSSCNQMLSW